MMSDSFDLGEGYARRSSEMPQLLRHLVHLIHGAYVVGFMMNASAWSDARVPGTRMTTREVAERFLKYAVDSNKTICLVIYENAPDRSHFPALISTLENVYVITMPFETPVHKDLDIIGVVTSKIMDYEYLGGRGVHPDEIGPESAVLVTLDYIRETR